MPDFLFLAKGNRNQYDQMMVCFCVYMTKLVNIQLVMKIVTFSEKISQRGRVKVYEGDGPSYLSG